MGQVLGSIFFSLIFFWSFTFAPGLTWAAQTPTFEIITEEIWLTEPNQNIALYGHILRPDPDQYPDRSFPTVVALPGGKGSGTVMVDTDEYRQLAEKGVVVVGFNFQGRGSGNEGDLTSEGEEDCNGFAGQDALKTIIEHLTEQSYVDVNNIGLQSFSFGLSLAAGALGRYPELPVQYLVDMEGPSNNLVTTFYDSDQEGDQICGHLSTPTDPSAENRLFWEEREAYRYIGDFSGYYLRAQSEEDHAQADGFVDHALEMIRSALAGKTELVLLNGQEMGNPANDTFQETEPLWMPGELDDYRHLASNLIIQMAKRFGANLNEDWDIELKRPFDVERAANGNTLITDGDDTSQIIGIDSQGDVISLYLAPLNHPHNALRLSGGNTLISDTGNHRILLLDGENRLLWESDQVSLSDGSTLNAPNHVSQLPTTPSDPNARYLVSDRNNHRVLELDETGTVHWQYGVTGVWGSEEGQLNLPIRPERLENGNTLITDQGNNRVIEVNPEGTIVWRYPENTENRILDSPVDADRLEDGNTLITDQGNNRVIEVNPEGQIVWRYNRRLSSPTDADRLTDGNTLIADALNGRIIEVNNRRRIVWSYPSTTFKGQHHGIPPLWGR
ncbi:MAG: hypothetical protein HQL52_17375 [Magnetococcales bacterium]|nr:hypothetical protein [Magnetococcales bacterium]